MDAKDILRLLIRHRFWIVLGIAALLPIIGYFVTAGSVKAQTEAKAAEIESAQQGAQSFASGTVPNGQYAEYTKKKIAEIEDDVRTAHERLYELQAPLLDWPERVAPELTAWGRDIPEDVPPNEIQAVAYEYTTVYEDYAKDVYQTVKPWDPATGEGIVVAPPMETLLQTVTFDINDLPSISKIWQYQENLWVRRSILEVIAQVNQKAGATDWETAAIKQINRLDVGNSLAVDHRTTALGFELKEPPEVTKGGQSLEPEAPDPSAAMAEAGGYYGDSSGMMPGMEYGMGGMMGMPGQGGGPVKFLQPEGVDLFRDYPAYVSVLIDQNSIQNFLVEFENSPMSMRVLEANWTRPKTRVQPPVKGQAFAGFGGMFGMGSGGGYFGMDMMGPGMMPGMEYGMMDGMGYGMMDAMMPGMEYMGPGMGGMMPANQPRARKKRELTSSKKGDTKDAAEPEKVTIFDPYYNIVELQVYVQARFFYPPAPEEAATEASPGDVPAEGVEPAPEATTPEGTAPAPGAEAPAEAAPEAAPDVAPSPGEPAEPGLEPGAAEAPAAPDAGTEAGAPADEPAPDEAPAVVPEPAEPGPATP